MDEAAFHARRKALDHAPCAFEKALLAGCAACELAQRHALAERELVACTASVARTDCETFLALLRERATFALRLPLPHVPAAHAVAMKLQCGGIAGLQQALAGADAGVHGLLATATARFGSLLDLPWPELVRGVVAWRGRRRHRDAGSP